MLNRGNIELRTIFKVLGDEEYAIVKLPERFPRYYIGSDIDVFVFNVTKVSKLIIKALEGYIEEGYEIKVTSLENNMHKHIDLISNEQIDIRFDLYGQMPQYHQLNIKPYYFYSILDRRQKFYFDDWYVFVPDKIDDITLRYFDYLEYYDKRKDKIKHIDIISNQLRSDIDLDLLSKRIFLYTDLRDITGSGRSTNQSYYFNKYVKPIIYIASKVKKKGIRGIFLYFKRRMKSV